MIQAGRRGGFAAGRTIRRGLWLALCVGCQEGATGPVQVANQQLGPMTIAVAPALNVSGSADLDENSVADLMASELSYASGVEVIPVNRVLAALADQGRARVESPGHALEIGKVLGADAVLVFAVTEYDAYEPPIVGISAQLYGSRRRGLAVSFDPVASSRHGAPDAAVQARSMLEPLASSSRVFDASHEWVCTEVKRFSELRSADTSPLGWRKYMASQKHYLRFCCHATIEALMSGGGAGAAATADQHLGAM